MNRFSTDAKQRVDAGTAGFTILETVIAIFVFTVGILGVLNMQIFSIQSNHKARMMSEATAIAASTVSELRAEDYNDAAISGDTETGTVHYLDDIDGFSRNYRVRRIASLDSKAAVITVTVAWQVKNKAHSLVCDYYKQDEQK